MTMNDDPFSDVKKYRQALGGIFEASDGLGELNQARTPFQPTGQGLRLECTCQNCGLPNGIEVDWEELTLISMKVPPQGWLHNAQFGVMMPHVGCAKCGIAVACGLTPDECNRALRGGIEAGYITEQQVAAARQHIANRAQGRR